MFIFLLLTAGFSIILESSAFIEIDCDYDFTEYNTCGSIYQCNLKKDIGILLQEEATVSTVTGDHKKWQFNEDVTGFVAVNKKINYFPQNLNAFFKDLKVIFVQFNGLKEIHQSDLKPFKNLIHLTIAHNPIEVLEDGLLDYNPNLEAIGFESTSIVHVGPNIFDHLNKLITFWFGEVPCINQNVDNSRAVTEKLIQRSKEQCMDHEFIEIKEKFDNFKKEIVLVHPTTFDEKISEFKKDFDKSKYSKFSPLKEEFEKLNKWASNVKAYY